MSEPRLWAVILAGGVGSRFWPVSTPIRPKQLLPLAGDAPLIRQTVDRIRPLVEDARIRILTAESLAGAIADALPGFGPTQFLLEPAAKGTAPVLARAAFEIGRVDPDAVMVSLHADHVIEPAQSFRAQLERVARASVKHRRLFTIGAVPTRPETGYGYVQASRLLEGEEGLYEVGRFVEKPTAAVAERYIREGHLWNTGLFVWPVRLLLEELRAHTPEIAAELPWLEQGRVDRFFECVPAATIDEALLERSQRVAVARATFRWDDVGTWDAVGRTRPVDDRGNATVGDAHAVDSSDCIVWAESGTVVVFGASDLVVVHTPEVTFVAPRGRAAELKQLLGQLPHRLVRPGED